MIALKAGRLLVQAVIVAVLGACAGGGGGGGGAVEVVAPPPPPPSGTPRPPAVPLPPLPPAAAPGSFPNTASAEYQANWGPGGIRAAAAWQFQNGHGEGVVIGVIDDGIDPNHPELQGRVDTVNSIDIVAGRSALTTDLSHGSELGALMAGNFNGSQTVGVAYRATLLAVRADNGSGNFANADLANAINYAVSRGVNVINLSLGSSNPSSDAVRSAFRAATQAGVIIVVSAGNSGAASGQPNYPGFLGVDPTIGNGLVLIAGGSNRDGSFNTTSNPAGSAASMYLVAPGWEIIVPDMGPPGPVPGFQVCGAQAGIVANLCRIQGTSYASPHVAAAVAVVKSAFPGLTSQQIVQIILQSTDDMGIAGIDAETGWGHLNLERAFAPIGTVAAPLMSLSAPVEMGPSAILGAAGPAFGDGMTHNAAVWRMTGFDSFGRPYEMDFSPNWSRQSSAAGFAAEAPRLWRSEQSAGGARMRMALAESVAPESYRLPVDRQELEQPAMRIAADIAPGFTASLAAHGARTMDEVAAEGAGHFAFVQSDLSLRLDRQLNRFTTLSLISESGEARAPFALQPSSRQVTAARAVFDLGRYGLDVTFGRLAEEHGLLGLVWSSALGETPGAETRFAGLGAHMQLENGWRLSAAGEFGVADLSQSGWLTVSAPLRTSAFSLQAARGYTPAWLDGVGVVTVSLEQPLRVEGGTLSFMAPTSDAYGRQHLAFEQRTFSPTPSGREMRAGLSYAYWVGGALSAFGEALYITEPGHIAVADPESQLRFGLRIAH